MNVRDRRVLIAGLELDVESAASRQTIDGLRAAPDASAVRILMSHRPDSLLLLPATAEIDLVVAGHTHGGQVVVPGYDPVPYNVQQQIVAAYKPKVEED